MYQMFVFATAFNNGGSDAINNWNTAAVTNMGQMFYFARNFNQNIGNWITGAVTDMYLMFGEATAFNQNIGSWNTAAVTNMQEMLFRATSFNQNIGSWNLNANVNLSGMLDNSGMDCANYSATLVGWNANPTCPTARTLGALGRTYGPTATAARANLVGPKGWTITGDGQSVTAASSTETLCINTALTNITHTTREATGIGAVTGLPAGVTATWFANTITISGIPTESGTFNYSIALTGGCLDVNAIGTIIVQPSPQTPTTVAISQPTCIVPTGSVSVTATNGIYYSIDGINYSNVSGVFSGLAPGTYNITSRNDDNGCTSLALTVVILPQVINTWNGTTWSNGAPIFTDTLIFNGNYNQNVDFQGCSCTINSGNIIIPSGTTVTITNGVNVAGGSLTFEDSSSLVQINDVVNEGVITYKRTALAIKGGDYVYWSSPVLNQPLNTIYTTPTQGPKHKWNTTLNNGNGVLPNISQGTWVNANGNTMETGKGYIVRGSSSSSMAATSINSTFYGVPNNGTIPVTIERGVYTGIPYAGVNGTQITNLDDNWNLLGNPYPSAINALQFLFDNSSSILGNVRLWTHGSDIALTNGTTVTNPYYGSFAYNYNSSDYLFINYLGTTIPTASDLIKTGQAFFVQMVDGPGNSSGIVNFNNLQRKNTYANDNFYRNSAENENAENGIIVPERHRIWLDIVNSNNNSVVTLLGYAEGATLGKDSFFDAMEKTSGSMGLYSLIDTETFAIQGRSLPFDISDEVPLSYNVNTPGTFHIAIRKVDGLFETQNIYLKDELLNSYHDLKTAPYQFTTDAGVFTNRFKIVYQNQTFGIPDNSDNQVIVYRNKAKSIQISTGNQTMNKVKIYDISGRLLVEKTNIDSNLLTINDIKGIADQVLLVSILTNENRIINKKVF
jgi:surface protein